MLKGVVTAVVGLFTQAATTNPDRGDSEAQETGQRRQLLAVVQEQLDVLHSQMGWPVPLQGDPRCLSGKMLEWELDKACNAYDKACEEITPQESDRVEDYR